MNKPKQVIVMRTDLGMRRGKQIAQGAHASLGAILNYGSKSDNDQLTLNLNNNAVQEWLNGQFTKICVAVNSEQELLDIYQKALDNQVNVKLIKDSGLTEFNGIPTLTCLALGPDYPENINPITGHLKLL